MIDSHLGPWSPGILLFCCSAYAAAAAYAAKAAKAVSAAAAAAAAAANDAAAFSSSLSIIHVSDHALPFCIVAELGRGKR